mmetsp:Transcript_2954/g.6743  ORF Transcript_2954/g.6743 Transcript_2954/m.6743 type:complete len:267 (-) Transcript_2954:1001-1801(-)
MKISQNVKMHLLPDLPKSISGASQLVFRRVCEVLQQSYLRVQEQLVHVHHLQVDFVQDDFAVLFDGPVPQLAQFLPDFVDVRLHLVHVHGHRLFFRPVPLPHQRRRRVRLGLLPPVNPRLVRDELAPVQAALAPLQHVLIQRGDDHVPGVGVEHLVGVELPRVEGPREPAAVEPVLVLDGGGVEQTQERIGLEPGLVGDHHLEKLVLLDQLRERVDGHAGEQVVETLEIFVLPLHYAVHFLDSDPFVVWPVSQAFFEFVRLAIFRR